MQTVQPMPLARDDTLFGVCQALGEDIGFNPFYLRLALGVALIWNPVIVIGGYLAAAVAIAVSRWIVPDPVTGAAEAMVGEPVAAREAVERNDNAEALAAAA
jgi:phage shock protein PspC (stress-responsive transcriptional regulator)